ncbi:hypothetical protein BH11PSE11_BH11PSE11_06740 [soil metagenome]
MNRRGNCHENAVVEGFFKLLKRERIRRRIYSTREEARQDVFNYIEMFTTETTSWLQQSAFTVDYESSISRALKVSRESGSIQPMFAPYLQNDNLSANTSPSGLISKTIPPPSGNCCLGGF